MKLDRTINVGTILHLVGVVITIIVLYAGVVQRLTTLELKVDTMWAAFQRRWGVVDGLGRNGP